MLSSSSYGIWSCFTYLINLKSTCDPSATVYLRSFNGNGQTVGNCVSKTSGSVVPGSDLSGTTSLFFSVQFNLTRFSLDTQVSVAQGTPLLSHKQTHVVCQHTPYQES